jgi:Zn-dependent protease
MMFARQSRNNNISRYASPLRGVQHHPMLQNPHIGSITYFSSFFGSGGGGRKPSIASSVGLIGAASILFGKTKYLLVALKVTKLATLGSMVLTIGTYSMFFGLPYAVGIVGLTLVHEMGHAAVMHRMNIPFTPMVFVPFVGAFVAMKDRPRDAWKDALIGAGGPVLGSAGAAVVAVGAHMTDSQLLYAVADFGFMINLFNLLPIGSMDGGCIAGALSKWVSLGGIGLGGLIAYQGVIQNPIFYLILIAGGYETFQRFYDPYHLPPNFYRITNTQRLVLTGGYAGLIVALLVAMDMNKKNRKPPEVLIHERELEERSFDLR